MFESLETRIRRVLHESHTTRLDEGKKKKKVTTKELENDLKQLVATVKEAVESGEDDITVSPSIVEDVNTLVELLTKKKQEG